MGKGYRRVTGEEHVNTCHKEKTTSGQSIICLICGPAEDRGDSADSSVQTCSKDGLSHLAPLVTPVGDDGDYVALPHLQTRHRKSSIASPELPFDSLTTINNNDSYLTEHSVYKIMYVPQKCAVYNVALDQVQCLTDDTVLNFN